MTGIDIKKPLTVQSAKIAKIIIYLSVLLIDKRNYTDKHDNSNKTLLTFTHYLQLICSYFYKSL